MLSTRRGRALRAVPWCRLPSSMRVLIVIDSLTLGGAEGLVATLAKAGRRTDIEVQVASLSGDVEDRALITPMMMAVGLTPTFLSISGLADPRALPRLVRAIRASECDVVHAHLEYSALLVPPAARIAGVPSVCTFHHVPWDIGRVEGFKERLAVFSASRSKATVFVSRASMLGFAQRYNYDRKGWTVLPNGIDLSIFTPRSATFPAELGFPGGCAVVTMVAAMRGSKGHDHAINAWQVVQRHVPEARLLLVGSGPAEAELQQMTTANGTSDTVVFAGLRTDVARLLRASSLVILPSDDEALPTVLIEAAACGKAVVATDVGGVAEVVESGRTGTLVPHGDTAALADAIVTLLSNDDLRSKLGAEARRVAEDRFDMYSWARRLRDIYEFGPPPTEGLH